MTTSSLIKMAMDSSFHLITIEKIVAGGLGLGRLPDGLIALVPYTLPGERVRIAERRRRKGYLDAEPVEILEPAAERTSPSCSFFGRCGGCDLQHAVYPAQLAIKAAILREHLDRSGLRVSSEAWEEPLAAPAPFGYRQRIRLQVDESGQPGYYRQGSHRVEPVTGCMLARPEINAAWRQLRVHEKASRLLARCGSLEISVSPDDGRVALVFNLRRRPRPLDLEAAREICGSIPGLLGGLLTGDGFEPVDPLARQSGPPSFLNHFTLPAAATGGRPLTLAVEPGGFCQVNPDQNGRLVGILLAWAVPKPEERMLDLFCGMGNFSLPLALTAGEVVGCDLQGSAIRSARRNAEQAGLNNCRFRRQAAAAAARELLAGGERFDLILLDPPRQGCAELLPFLSELGASRLIYISCDPATLGRDLARLAEQGFRPRRIRLLDMFPQTHHLETITLLERGL